ncbi:hypothetical protein N7448_008317 [Penicillium atrosanguineum]|uniref:Uncharacterized protein n=1 Tax=Penicillium atrosanguineum TaxID=1132637 RepID=A0A9W9QC38_9EURO|nr:uncharacterized protein N7443_000667 [Penicillium atrosanguineum]KAJ5127538.1 hypothetical protein N7448_008317 [Penicillium atrosanguineum]KAJ5313783.1 hypothetical protein N7443_000667 [Penicillium atrosanguineum]KAJ5330956.1 hypothetical protein N7476_000739 [Penicillium atrosanguineum]
METAEPPYDFHAHPVGAFVRRPMDTPLFPYYSHPHPAPYSLPYQAPTSAAYSYASLTQPPPYHYLVSQPLSTPPRLVPEQPSLPDIRPAKNAISQVVKTEHAARPCVGGQALSMSAEDTKQAIETEFSTGVDVLMKAIQARPDSSPVPQSLPPLQHLTPPGYPSYPMSPPRRMISSEGQLSRSGKKRKYTCHVQDCGKSFAQKTHLDIHTRAHTGDKPFKDQICKEPECGQRFSQLGNLKTHQRRHTGEKPFSCDICHKRFAQRGNVRAHQNTHMDKKPFICRLDDCGKKFTQLGNLKSHQNKFHAGTLGILTQRFSQETGPANLQEQELWEYFANLYKNSNKGIKGRGKDRRIAATKRPASVGDHMQRMASLESEDDMHSRRGSYEDSVSMYTAGSSSDGDDPGPYYMDRRGP